MNIKPTNLHPVIAPPTQEAATAAAVSAPTVRDADRMGTSVRTPGLPVATVTSPLNPATNAPVSSLAGASAAVATSSDPLRSLNETIATTLKPFNTPETSADAVVTKAQTNATRAVDIAGHLAFERRGKDTTIRLSVPQISYAFPETPGAEPVMRLKAAIDADLVKLLGQDTVNRLAGDAETEIQEIAASMLKEYGDAAKVKTQITRKDVDAKGNVTALGASIDLAIDLSKLPAEMSAADVTIIGAKAQFLITTKGADVTLTLRPNAQATDFQSSGTGLKEWIDKLLAQDKNAISEIQGFISMLSSWTESMIEQAPVGGS